VLPYAMTSISSPLLDWDVETRRSATSLEGLQQGVGDGAVLERDHPGAGV
jgi:hypothetical protein